MNKLLQLVIVIIAFSGTFLPRQILIFGLIMQLFITAIFFIKSHEHFVRSIFWPIYLFSQLFIIWPISFIIPIIMYFAYYFIFLKINILKEWFRIGKINRGIVVLSIITIFVSSGALIVWVFIFKPDLADLYKMVPTSSILKIILIGLLFSIFNSVWEEITFKGILWSNTENLFSKPWLLIIFQGLLFGIIHLNGFPRGWIGAGLAACYGIALGFLKQLSNGLIVPMIVHFFADATIFGILVLTIVNK